MVASVKPARGSHDATPTDPTDKSEPVPGDAPTVDPLVARPVVYSTGDPLVPLATRWPHIEAELVRKRAHSRRRR